MSKVTICPHFLLNYSQKTPNEIESDIIYPLFKCIQECLNCGIPIILSHEILEKFYNTYPWNLMSDKAWKGYIMQWYQLIIEKIINRCEIRKNVNSGVATQSLCTNLNDEINKIFIVFLDGFASRDLPKKMSEEGIISSTSCNQAILYSNCHSVSKPEDVSKVKYPWLRLYKKPLPPEGEFPFIPPVNWKNNVSPIRGKYNGYIDNFGVEWIWDTLHKDHWDVQDGSPYKNVSTEGRIL